MAVAYRTHVSIIADVLTTVKEFSFEGYENGASVTHLIRKANVPHQRLSTIVTQLKQSGLVQEGPSRSKYKISDRGLEFLNAYNNFKGFAESFGLKV